MTDRDDRYEWITVKEYALYRRVTERTVRDWIKAGKLSAERTAGEHGHWRIKVARAS
jgi:excisionase family DNA binding protein